MSTAITYLWWTDAAHGEIVAADPRSALALLIADGEWSELDSPTEMLDLQHGAWLDIRTSDGVPLLKRRLCLGVATTLRVVAGLGLRKPGGA